MIAKRVSRKGKSSNCRELVHYILDKKNGGEKARLAWSTNCSVPDDLDLCLAEIIATQELNTRSKIDKTYHLVISLSAGEDLTDEQFKEVETRFCESIGLGQHQRICAVHADTKNIHMHLSISKVHPLTLNCIEPYYDKLKLQETCRELEQKFGLKPDAGVSPKLIPAPSEVHQGLESFTGYIRESLSEELKQLIAIPNKNWQDAQALAGRFGLEIREHGAGLVFSHRSKKLFVKASSIERDFSKKKLEAAFGKFEASQWKGLPEKEYSKGPSKRNPEKDKLFAEFKTENDKWLAGRKESLARLSEVRYSNIQEIKKRYAKRRLELKRDTIIAKGRKKAIYEKLSLEMKKELDAEFAKTKIQRDHVYSSSNAKPWLDWVHERANKGDETALEILRYKLSKTEDYGLGALLGKESSHHILDGISRKVNRDGTIEYETGGGKFIDLGDAIILKSITEDSVKAALLVAQVKFGEDFTPKGGGNFMQILRIANGERKIVSSKEIKTKRQAEKSGPELQ